MSISQTVFELEAMRKKCRANDITLMILAAFTMISMWMTSIVGDPSWVFLPLLGFAGIFIMSFNHGKYKKDFQRYYKNTFATQVLSQMFTQLNYNWDNGFSEDVVDRIGLTLWGNRFSSEDYVSGMYNGVFFEQSDVVVKHRTSSGKNSHTYTYFKGRMFSFSFPKTDILSTMVFDKGFNYKGKGGKLRYEKVEMESEHFNRRFQVKAVRPIDAFYVLTPQMMECICKIEEKYGNVAMRYELGKLYVAINMSGNAFNASISKPIVYTEEIERIKYDSWIITDIIDTLKLSPLYSGIQNNSNVNV